MQCSTTSLILRAHLAQTIHRSILHEALSLAWIQVKTTVTKSTVPYSRPGRRWKKKKKERKKREKKATAPPSKVQVGEECLSLRKFWHWLRLVQFYCWCTRDTMATGQYRGVLLLYYYRYILRPLQFCRCCYTFVLSLVRCWLCFAAYIMYFGGLRIKCIHDIFHLHIIHLSAKFSEQYAYCFIVFLTVSVQWYS